MKKITTVCGDIAPDELGFTLIHEHTVATLRPGFAAIAAAMGIQEMPNPDLQHLTDAKMLVTWIATPDGMDFDDEESEIYELESLKKFGGNAIVEASGIGMRLPRYAEKNKWLSEKTGVHIVACTGYYTESYWPKGTNPFDKDSICSLVTREINEGIDGTGIRPGIIKMALVGKPTGGLTDGERAMLRNLASVVNATGYPIEIHPCFTWESVHETLDVMIEECGVDPEKIDICHFDSLIAQKATHPSFKEYIRNSANAVDKFVEKASSVLARGVFANLDGWSAFHTTAGYDNGTGWAVEDGRRLACTAGLIEAGYASKIMLSHDKCGKYFNYGNGAYGYTRIPCYAVPALKLMGYEKEAHLLTVENPARFLAHD